jgi:hypothetical protein
MKSRWVYLGQAAGVGVPVIDRFQEIDKNQEKVGNRFAFKKFRQAFVPGGIYDVEQEEESGVKTSGIVFSGEMISDEAWLDEIRTDHYLFQGRKKMKSLETKFKSEHKLTTDLTKLAITYRDLWGVDKLIFEWMVLAKLRELAGKA